MVPVPFFLEDSEKLGLSPTVLKLLLLAMRANGYLPLAGPRKSRDRLRASAYRRRTGNAINWHFRPVFAGTKFGLGTRWVMIACPSRRGSGKMIFVANKKGVAYLLWSAIDLGYEADIDPTGRKLLRFSLHAFFLVVLVYLWWRELRNSDRKL
jgi:hypothetical protein